MILSFKKLADRADNIFPNAFHTGWYYNSLEEDIFQNEQSIFFQPNHELLFDLLTVYIWEQR